MIKFFNHIGNRQESHGIKDAFRFKAVLSSRKKGDLGGANYLKPAPNPAFTLEAMDEPDEPAPSPVTENNPTIEMDQIPSPTSPAPAPALNGKSKTNRDMAMAVARRGKTRGKGRAKEKVQSPAFRRQSNNTSDDMDPAPAPAPALEDVRPRPRPRPTGKARETVHTELSLNEDPHPLTLTLDPGHQWDPNIDLDPSLDPDFYTQPLSNDNEQILTSWLTVPQPDIGYYQSQPSSSSALPQDALESSSSFITDPARKDVPGPARSPRRKGKSADVLAREEALKWKSNEKGRR